MSKHLVLSANPYDFEDKQGKRIKGVKLAYINSRASSRGKELGHPPTVMSVDAEFISKLEGKVPGLFELEFDQVAVSGRKPELVLLDMKAIAPVDVPSLFK